MIDFNKNLDYRRKLNSLKQVSKEHRRLQLLRKVTKNNKEFLRALGFKI